MRNLNFYINEKYIICFLKYLGPYFYLEDLTVTFKLNYKGEKLINLKQPFVVIKCGLN